MQLRSIIARNVAELRKSLRLSQAELAARLQVNKQTIWRIESGETNVGADTLEALASAFGIEPAHLLIDGTRRPAPGSGALLARIDEIARYLQRALETIRELSNHADRP